MLLTVLKDIMQRQRYYERYLKDIVKGVNMLLNKFTENI